MPDIREYRGKRVDNGEWVYGYPIVTHKDNKVFIQSCDYSDLASIWNGVTTYRLSSYHLEQYEVIPETVGQYTVLKDKNVKEIYEDDLVKIFNSIIHIVVFRNGAYGYETEHSGFISFAENESFKWKNNQSEYIEIIGNIHDNKDLLE